MLAAVLLFMAGQVYELNGRLDPPARAAISIWGATTPFNSRTAAGSDGRFQFKKLAPGTYTIAVYVKGRGEMRRTVEVGPGVSDEKRRVAVTLTLNDSAFVYGEVVKRQAMVDAGQLAIPEKAQREYQEAVKDLQRRRTASAVRRLERAVEIAPRFSVAWNDLGTIAYKQREYRRAEECFRMSLAADPRAYEPLVNLGGVLVTLNRPDEAIEFNLQAVLQRPNDALANSQLGMNYFQLRKLDLARKYLEAARRIDPAHFSHPQLLLAEVMLREGQRQEAAAVMEEFLRHHPDYAQAAAMRSAIEKLRK